MTVYQYKTENGWIRDCLEELQGERGHFTPSGFVLAEITNDMKNEAACNARRGYRLSALKVALRSIKNSSHDEIVEARRIIEQYL